MTRASGTWLDQTATQSLFKAFDAAGYCLHCVGGCVRNALLGEDVVDIDMSTNASPQAVMALAEKLNLRAVPTGIEHGTITVINESVAFEITTYRKDVETDGRRAVISYAETLAEDAKRRDLTINALYCDAQGEITDPVDGLPDIEARRVRFIGDPSARIKEDYLRILRFFRFYAWYGVAEGGIDAEGLAACAELADGIETLSAERIGSEMRKLLSARDPSPAVAAMAQSGVLHRVMPGADPGFLAVLVHFEEDMAPNWMRRSLMLGGEEVAERWRLTKSETRDLGLMHDALRTDLPLPEIAYRHGAAQARDVMLVRSALSQSAPDAGIEQQITRAAEAVFPIKAADLMPKLQGPELGAKLSRLEARWIASDFTLSKADLLSQ